VCFTFFMAHVQTRRNFLWTAPLAAAVALPLTDTLLHASAVPSAGGQSAEVGPRIPVQVFPAATVQDMMNDLKASHGTKDLIPPSKDLAITMTMNSEEKNSGKEFEFHAHRDHVFQVLDGATRYELGGTPKNARETKPGEWLAPESEGFKVYELKKGDMLTVPRMTPHKRITEESVTLLLISATTPS
jgi:mannose-6-phosphate isomerase-like protein (cupin superfamily)